jgi:MFS family permease
MTHPASPPVPADDHPRRWSVLALLATAELLGMSLWFAASAVSGDLAARWSLDPSATGWLTTIVQAGFVVGTAMAALLNLADVVPSRWYFAAAATAGAIVNAGVALVPEYRTALVLRFFTGFFLAGVYPPAMKMAATWFRSRRGLAIGTIVGALTVGKATPYLVHALPAGDVRAVILVASSAALVAALLIGAFYVDGPYPFPSRRFSWGLVGTVFRERQWRLATGGYLGHMWELYAFWTWIPVFISASVAARAATGAPAGSERFHSLIAFGTIAVGGVGCVWGGLAADRRGREWLVSVAMAISGCCCLAIVATYAAPLWVVAIVAWVWGFFVIADSAQFSALVTESVPAHAVGTALTVQTSIGFLLTMASIQLVSALSTMVGWQWAFPILAIGPVAGVASIRQLQRLKGRGRTGS